jgi:hypothetical protein
MMALFFSYPFGSNYYIASPLLSQAHFASVMQVLVGVALVSKLFIGYTFVGSSCFHHEKKKLIIVRINTLYI